jgi:hypothetical protein
MKHCTDELTGRLLDEAAAIAEGAPAKGNWYRESSGYLVREGDTSIWSPSEYWSQGGPIIEREKIKLVPLWDGTWEATPSVDRMSDNVSGDPRPMPGPLPLVAACRAFVYAKLGEEVEIPDGC